MSLTKQELIERKKFIGASDAPIIVGASPWSSPYQLWLDKVSKDVVEKTSAAMQRGNDLEETARNRFEEMSGLIMFPKCVKMHVNIPYMRASLDGIDIEEKNIVEIKCPNAATHAIAVAGEVPAHYMPQLQHQIEVCGIEMAYYFSFDGNNGVIVKVFRDEKYIKNLITKEAEFWECVQNFTPPEKIAKDYNQRTANEWLTQASNWRSARQRLKSAEEEEQLYRSKLISLAAGNCSTGGGVLLTKIHRKGAVDYSKISELKHLNLDTYRKENIELFQIKEQ